METDKLNEKHNSLIMFRLSFEGCNYEFIAQVQKNEKNEKEYQ